MRIKRLLGAVCVSVLFCLGICAEDLSYGTMKVWSTHLAFNNVNEIAYASERVYALAEEALFSIDKEDGTITYYNKQNGLNGSVINHIVYCNSIRTLLVLYEDGMMDFITDDGEIFPLADLQLKQMNASKKVNAVTLKGDEAYLAMEFGILVVDVRQREIVDLFYIGDEASEVAIRQVAFVGDSIYAISKSVLFSASESDNLLDFSVWKKDTLYFGTGNFEKLLSWNNELYALRSNKLFCRNMQYEWLPIDIETKNFIDIKLDDRIYCIGGLGVHYVKTDHSLSYIPLPYEVRDIHVVGQTYWSAALDKGVAYHTTDGEQYYKPDGPHENMAYRIRFQGNRMIMVPGGYFGVFYNHPGSVMLYENGNWLNFTNQELRNLMQIPLSTDYSDGIIDPEDPNHFYVGSFGCGLLEFRNNGFYKRHNAINSPLDSMASPEYHYTWVDAFAYDENGNLWMTNISERGVKVLMRNSSWVCFPHQIFSDLGRAQDLIIWNQNPNLKIVSKARAGAGLAVLDDNGTIANFADDKTDFKSAFIDQNGKLVQPTTIHCMTQMANGELWVGTNAGIFIIDDPSRLTDHSFNVCRRIVIARDDGTQLGDYLLGTEQVNAICEDGVGRKWIGTATSGLYLMSADGEETIEHFTTVNSPLLSDEIQTIAINPLSGEVFVGTGSGLMSYKSDASESKENYSEIYAYPNPVQPNFVGTITISGLMNNSIVHIIDNGGNLVCETRSNGGIAIWDGKNANGRRVASGVYTVLCNTADGQNHTVTKIMVL